MTFDTIENTAAATRNAKRLGEQLYSLARQQSSMLEELTRHIMIIQRVEDPPKLRALLGRIDRLHELRRMAEYGSFQIEVARLMDELWTKIP